MEGCGCKCGWHTEECVQCKPVQCKLVFEKERVKSKEQDKLRGERVNRRAVVQGKEHQGEAADDQGGNTQRNHYSN